MKRRKIILWTGLAILLALGVTVGPVAARIAEAEADARQVEAIEKRVASLGEEKLEKYRNLAKWYNHQLETGNRGLRGIYDSVLDLGEGRMGVLDVPELGVRLPIAHGHNGKVGHDPNSPLPIGGRGNHTVLILTEGYAWMEEQPVYIDILGQRLAYRVESVQVMPPGWSPERTGGDGQDLLTLVQDHKDTRTIVRCVRCADLTVRPLDMPEQGQITGASVLLPVLLLPALRCCARYANHEQTNRICGFHRKKPEKSNLF